MARHRVGAERPEGGRSHRHPRRALSGSCHVFAEIPEVASATHSRAPVHGHSHPCGQYGERYRRVYPRGAESQTGYGAQLKYLDAPAREGHHGGTRKG